MSATQKAVIIYQSEDEMKGLIQSSIASLPSPDTRRVYLSRLLKFIHYSAAVRVPFDREHVEIYLAGLRDSGSGQSARSQTLAAIKRLATVCAERKAISSETALSIAHIKGENVKGVRSGNWLTSAQASTLINEHGSGPKEYHEEVRERRDRAVIALLLGCGLRRAEAAKLTWAQLQNRENRPVIVDLKGKGERIRTIPVPSWAHRLIGEWLVTFQAALVLDNALAGSENYFPDGFLLRSIREDGTINGSLSASGIWMIVKDRAKRAGMSVAPHDLRRTFARLARKGGAKIEQIQVALGHSSVQTTEKYLNTALDLEDPACDHLGIEE